MTKRKTAASIVSPSSIDEEVVDLGAEPPREKPTAETAPAHDVPGGSPTPREPGDDREAESAGEPRNASWAPRTVIAVPLTEEAKRDHTKGEVARYIDGYDQGVGARIDSPDPQFRPSEQVKEPLKEDHRYRESMRWDKKNFHKKVVGKRRDASERSPVGERLDAEERFEAMVERRRAEIDKDDGGKTPFRG